MVLADDDVDVRGVKQRVSVQGRKERWLVDGVPRAPFRPITIEAVLIDRVEFLLRTFMLICKRNCMRR